MPVPLTVDELLDRQEIGDVLTRYASAIDNADWDLFTAVFTEDATIDYSVVDGPTGSVGEARDFLIELLADLPRHHLIGSTIFEFSQGRKEAEVTAYFIGTLAPKREAITADTTGFLHTGGWYQANLRKTANGWRIRTLLPQIQWHVQP